MTCMAVKGMIGLLQALFSQSTLSMDVTKQKRVGKLEGWGMTVKRTDRALL